MTDIDVLEARMNAHIEKDILLHQQLSDNMKHQERSIDELRKAVDQNSKILNQAVIGLRIFIWLGSAALATVAFITNFFDVKSLF